MLKLPTQSPSSSGQKPSGRRHVRPHYTSKIPFWHHWKTDLQAVIQRDSTIRSELEALLYSPGFHALLLHRLAHSLHAFGLPLIPRLISQFNRFLTGIEIHPGAQIGQRVFIAHGMGVVIGETAIVGNGSVIYQDVTLGGTGKETGKRHPTLRDNVVVEAGAKVLGNIVIGNNVRIGAGSIILRDAPDNSVMVGVPGRVIYRGNPSEQLPSDELLPDLEAQVIQILFERLKQLEAEVTQLRAARSLATHQPAQLTDKESKAIAKSNHLIEDFLDGAGI